MSKEKGVIYRISGPVVTAIGISPRMYEVVRVGNEGLMGEVIELHGDQSVIQVYEETSGVRPGEPVICLLYTSPSPRDKRQSRMPSSA